MQNHECLNPSYKIIHKYTLECYIIDVNVKKGTCQRKNKLIFNVI